ncbi:C40 family peptidase [Sphaerisporangium sp. NPDC049003]|uniref:C40 family peptidase n=1 Tax=Sphaerisporangium sp. NPDC049003 TaxID=3364517 RepID=UPI00371A5F3D
MIVEAGLGVKALIAGGGIVSGIALLAGTIGGARLAETSADPAQLTTAVCSYIGQPVSERTPRSHRRTARSARATAVVPPLDREQSAHARIIVKTARASGLPQRAAVIAIATALQESDLKNNAVGGRGTSFGIFQQTPVNGWGTKAQVTNPHYAARKFFSALVKVKGWQSSPLTVAAQKVQKSAYPNAYARHEGRAVKIVAALWPSNGHTQPVPGPPTKESLTEELGITPADLSAVRFSVKVAGSLGIDRDSVVAEVSRVLQDRERAELPAVNPERARKRAEEMVTSVAAQLCRELRDGATTAVGQADGIAPGVTSPSVRAMTAVRAALTTLGMPYSWGGGGAAGPSFGTGRGASTKGFDCSGLTQYAWARAGVSIPRVTYAQWTYGSHVRGPIQPGDLLFYETNPRIPGPDHVGIAISATKMVHAPRTGTVIQIAPIQRPGYVGAIRPDQH